MSSTALRADAAPIWAKHYPPGVDWRFDTPVQPLFTLLDRSVADHADKPALVFAGIEYTYAELGQLVARAACGLQARGVKKGVKVGLFMPNAGYSVVMYFAILKAGGTVVNYNPVYTEADLKKQVEDSETDILVTLDAPALVEKAQGLLQKPRLREIILCGTRDNMLMPARNDALVSGEGWVWFADLVANDGRLATPEIDPKLSLIHI